MAINEDNQNTQRSQQPSPAPTAGGWTFGGNSLLNSPIPRSASSEYYKKIKAGLTEIYAQGDRRVEFTVLELSQAIDQALDFSCLLVCTRFRDQPKLGIAMHILLVAETGAELPPLTDNVDGRPVMIKRVPGDAFNSILVNRAKRLATSHFQVADKDILMVDGTVLSKRFNPADQGHLQSIAMVAALAGVTELETRRPDFEDLNLAKIVGRGTNSVEVTYQRQQLEDAAANIVRSDVTISFTDRKGEGDRTRQLNSGDRINVVSDVSAYIDPVWSPAQDPNLYGGFLPSQQVQTQKFAARIILTSIRCAMAQTPASTLLALSTALALRNPQIWYQAFRPVAGGKRELDMYDPGAFNIEGNIPVPQPGGGQAPDQSGYGRPIDTKAEDFRPEHLGLYLSTLFHRDPMFALDVPEYGPETHYLSVFAAAARPEGDAARNRIVNAANDLTNGEFGRHFTGKMIFVSQPERIHGGTWMNDKGETRDLRDFDYLAVANLIGTRQPGLIKDFSDTFLRTDTPETIRLEQRARIIQELSGQSAKFTHFFQRVTFSAAFLDALDKAINAHQLRVSLRTPSSGNDFINQRGVATFAAQAMLGAGPSFIQAGGYSPGAAAFMPYQNFRY